MTIRETRIAASLLLHSGAGSAADGQLAEDRGEKPSRNKLSGAIRETCDETPRSKVFLPADARDRMD